MPTIDKGYFTGGLKNYLNAHSYDNAATHHLWTSLQEMAHDPTLSAMMNTWTQQQGYPLLTVSYRSSSHELALSQEQFFLFQNNDTAATATDNGKKKKNLWMIPLEYQVGSTVHTITMQNVTNYTTTTTTTVLISYYYIPPLFLSYLVTFPFSYDLIVYYIYIYIYLFIHVGGPNVTI